MKNPKIIETIIPGATYFVPTYIISDDGVNDGSGLDIIFCKGNKIDKSFLRQEGVFTETLIQVAKTYLEAVNQGELETTDTTQAILKLEEALMWLNKRAEDRKLREVQATYSA